MVVATIVNNERVAEATQLGSRIPLSAMLFQIFYGTRNSPTIACGDVSAISRHAAMQEVVYV
jgi:hypothetical protein